MRARARARRRRRLTKLTFRAKKRERFPNNSRYDVVDFEFLSTVGRFRRGASPLPRPRHLPHHPSSLLSPFSSRSSTWRPWAVARRFGHRPRWRESEFALILAMLLRPCLGQAMVCMVVLSAAALASQTHYSYLNEFSLAPSTTPFPRPRLRPIPPSALATTTVCASSDRSRCYRQ